MLVADPSTRPTSTAARRGFPLAVVAVAAIAFAVRLIPILIGGGLFSYGRYDDGVYYAAADALTFGRVPYKAFVLLHPPGLMLTLTPFAALGRLTTDAAGLATARVAFMLIGALNAVLVALVVRRWSRTGGVLGGLLYAVWIPAVYTEQTTLLEPLGTTATLVALILLTRNAGVVSRRIELLAGAALGIGLTMKIWYVVPVLVIIGWQCLARGWKPGARVVAGVCSTGLAILLPFFILAPTQMFRMIVSDQLLRPQTSGSILKRPPSILGVAPLISHHNGWLGVVTVLAAAVVLASAAYCVRHRTARILVALLIADAAVLILSPTFFEHYSELTAAPSAAVIGVAVGSWSGIGATPVMRRAGQLALVAVCVVSAIAVSARPNGYSFDRRALAAAAGPGCVASDDPTVLVEINRLSSDLRAGCQLPVDVTGITYDRLSQPARHGIRNSRRNNVAWQRYLVSYLTSGHTFVLARRGSDGLSASTSAELKRYPLLTPSTDVGLVLHLVGAEPVVPGRAGS
jgi:hypothetical protein